MRRATARSAAWDYLLERDPDLALLQEVGSIPDSVRSRYACHSALATGKSGCPQRFSTAILVRGGLGNAVPLRSSAPWVQDELDRFAGNLLACEVEPHGGPAAHAVSVYSPAWPVDRGRLESVDVTSVRLTQNRDVWVADLLWSALSAYGSLAAGSWVVAGDFNLSETFDLWRGGPRGNREYLDRMADLGLVECLRASRGELTPTSRNTDRTTIKHQMDHLFVSASLAERLVSCEVGQRDTVFGQNLSDHLPIIAEFAPDAAMIGRM